MTEDCWELGENEKVNQFMRIPLPRAPAPPTPEMFKKRIFAMASATRLVSGIVFNCGTCKALVKLLLLWCAALVLSRSRGDVTFDFDFSYELMLYSL
ncbi:hypothetical protein BV898_19228 [Hypsibius exemplaris]|uniref:Uncharacterized protein n=1 Tax=Hypsibius exemplaris TaxID=2072580 RepID=A0A9X6NRT4_HYPEX|nr:hypothetical protein BV898_19228 [Hypsibius exemplaris]